MLGMTAGTSRNPPEMTKVGMVKHELYGNIVEKRLQAQDSILMIS
jgi:hypothetical protein